MNWLQAIVLGIVQGLTEFLPVSSSGHLVLVPWALGWGAPGLLFDTMAHWGTLAAVVVFFRKDIWVLIRAWVDSVRARRITSPEARVAWLLILATIPAGLAGFFLNDFFTSLFGSPTAVAACLLVTGILLIVGDAFGRGEREMGKIKVADAVVIGLAQAVSIAPGISRSGATIVGGVLRGLSRQAAARFSFLLSIPIILSAGLLQLLKAIRGAEALGSFGVAAVGALAAAVVGYFAIAFMLRHLQRGRLLPFAIYCWCAGGLALIAALLGFRS
jgi:undecaprenyl-diphosphatase